jgi:hypothetical protein
LSSRVREPPSWPGPRGRQKVRHTRLDKKPGKERPWQSRWGCFPGSWAGRCCTWRAGTTGRIMRSSGLRQSSRSSIKDFRLASPSPASALLCPSPTFSSFIDNGGTYIGSSSRFDVPFFIYTRCTMPSCARTYSSAQTKLLPFKYCTFLDQRATLRKYPALDYAPKILC